MATVIRLSRQGRRNRPHYRVGVFDSRTRRDGPPIEYVGHYDPLVEDDEKKVTLNTERITYWLGQGARVSDTVRSFLKKRGVVVSRRGHLQLGDAESGGVQAGDEKAQDETA